MDMIGHKWVKAMATVVEVRGHPGVLPSPGSGPTYGPHALREYVIDTRDPKGGMLRTTLSEEGMFVHPVGSTLPIDVNFKTGEAKIDPHAMRQMVDQMMQNRHSAASGLGGTGGLGADLGGLVAGVLGAAGTGAVVPPMIFVGGQQVQVSAARAAELRQLTHALVSGDPAAKQAARDRIQQLKAELSQQVGGPGYAASGSTFDPIGPASTLGQASPGGGFGDPAPGASFDQPFTSISVTQAGPPGQFDQVTPPSSGAPSAFDQFSPSTAQGTVEERIAKLQQLLSKGILTESEFQAQRQRIINEI